MASGSVGKRKAERRDCQVRAQMRFPDDRPAIEYFLSDHSAPFSIDALLGASEALSPEVAAQTELHRHLLRAHALGKQGQSELAADEVGLVAARIFVKHTRSPDAESDTAT